MNTEFEPSATEHSNLRTTVDGYFKQTLSKFFQPLKPRRTLKPKLRTACSPAKQPTAKGAFFSLMKRNFGQQLFASLMGYCEFAKEALENMMDTFGVPDWRERAKQFDFVRLSREHLAEWMKAQTPQTLDALGKMDHAFALEELADAVDDYEFIMKKTPKTPTDTKPQKVLATVQTIMFHNKRVNSYYGSLVRELDRRFRSLIRPEVLYNKGKNMDEIEAFLNRYYQASFGALAIENDFSDFDRSQERVATALDLALLSMLGMHPEDLDEWARGHYKHSNISFSLGLVVYLRWQRKSGDVTTSFCNTVLNMTAMAWCLGLKHEEVLVGMFLGDDSFLQLIPSPGLKERVKQCSEKIGTLFNGTAKTSYFDTGYFCGLYILQVGDEIKLAADPYRRAVKLGRWDMKDHDMVKENWISFQDSVRNYEDRRVQEALVGAVHERHPWAHGPNVDALVCSLYTLKKSFKEFRNFWDRNVSVTFY